MAGFQGLGQSGRTSGTEKGKVEGLSGVFKVWHTFVRSS